MLRDVQRHTNGIMPRLVDDNIYYRICKIVYGQSYARQNLGTLLGRPPPTDAIWHAYKCAVTRCYSAFFPPMMYIVHGKLPEGHEIPTTCKHIVMERLFASLLVVAIKLRDMPNLQFMGISRRARPHSVATQLQPSQLTVPKGLLYEYVPAVFLVGMQVRDCYRGGSNGRTARDVLDGTLHRIMHFGLPHKHKIEYVCSIMVARLLWS